MYDGYSLIENKMELRFFGADTRKFEAGEVLDGERLPFELYLCALSGSVKIVLKKEERMLSQGETALIPYDAEFRLEAQESAELLWVGADYRVFTNLRVFSIFDIPQKPEKESGEMLEICRAIHRLVLDSEFTNSRMENALEVNFYLYRLALCVIRKSMPKKESRKVMSRFERLAPVLWHIGEHIDKSCPISELCELVGLSEDAFYRYFKSTIGSAPKEYLISERLRRARIMLASSKTSVTDISKRCGYENPFYFSTLFHGKYGMSPTVYRERTSALINVLA